MFAKTQTTTVYTYTAIDYYSCISGMTMMSKLTVTTHD